jgi:methionyl-tRNA formyltransferase
MIRVVFLTSLSHGLPCRCLQELAASDEIEVVSAVLVEPGLSSHRLKTFKRKCKKAIAIGIPAALNAIRINRWFDDVQTERIDALCANFGFSIHRVAALNSERTIELFKAADADLGVSAGNTYISKRIFGIPPLGMINVHMERLPEYQNAHSVLWPIYHMERATGLTVHAVDDKINNGAILYREEYPIEFRRTLKRTVTDTMRHTFKRVGPAVRYVCENFAELSREAKPQTNGKTYTTPSVKAFLTMVRNNRALYASAPPQARLG